MKKKTLFFIILFLSFAFTPFAQERDRANRSQGKDDPYKARRLQLQEKVRTVRGDQLKKNLQLKDEQVTKINHIINEYETKQKTLQKQQRESANQLRQSLRADSTVSNEQIQKQIQQIRKIRTDLSQIQDAEFDAVSKHLDPKQQGRYLLFRQDFNRRVNQIVRQKDRPPRSRKDRRGPRAEDQRPN